MALTTSTSITGRRAAFVAAAVGATMITIAFLTSTGSAAPAGRFTGGDNRTWFWTRDYAQQALYRNGLDWSNATRDSVRGVKCSGLGHWIYARSGHVPMYRDFYCYIDPRGGRVYRIVFHVLTQRTYRFEFDSYQDKQSWWWTPQKASDSLVAGGIQWTNGLQTLNYASCSAFGSSLRKDSAIYYHLFYCTVRPTSGGYPYGLVLNVTDETHFNVRFVTYTDELPVTPVDTTPVPSSNTDNNRIANDLVGQQISVDATRDWIARQNRALYGSNFSPPGSSIIAGSVGCAGDPFDNSPYKSYGVC